MLRIFVIIGILLSCASSGVAEGFDHRSWDTLLQSHVRSIDGGKITEVDYRGMQAERPALQSYLDKTSSVDEQTFNSWPASDQLAFLINVYNAWTVELILTRYPELKSIKDLGSLFQSPWKKKFIPLLGETRSLDDVEHGLIRESGRYNEPRIHFAVNCASIGCPALRPEAYRGDIIEQQLEDAERLFLSDQTRNRVVNNVFEVSSVFKWYGDDFRKGWQGIESLEGYLLNQPEIFGLTEKSRATAANSKVKIKYLKYDWNLNDISNNP